MLTLPPEEVATLLDQGDTRWIHRSAHDLMGVAPDAARSAAGIPRGRSLYGPLPDQLEDETSFARQLQAILAVRDRYGIPTSTQVEVPDVPDPGLLVLVHELPRAGQLHLSVLNFSDRAITATVASAHLPPGAEVTDMFTDRRVATVDALHGVPVVLEPHQGHALLVRRPAPGAA
jgi:hypothetical protein